MATIYEVQAFFGFLSIQPPMENLQGVAKRTFHGRLLAGAIYDASVGDNISRSLKRYSFIRLLLTYPRQLRLCEMWQSDRGQILVRQPLPPGKKSLCSTIL